MSKCKVAVYSSKQYDKDTLSNVCTDNIELLFLDVRLSEQTVVLAKGCEAVCVFVNDDLSEPVLSQLKQLGIKSIALRCAGFNNLDLLASKRLGMEAARVPAYSPEAVAEHAIALIMSLNRRIHKAYNRTKEDNFSLQGLLGFNVHGKTVGIVGTGKIGLATIRILTGFGAKVVAYDPYPETDKAQQLGFDYLSYEQLVESSDIISLHCPLNQDTYHMINADMIQKMKKGVMLINTSRGGLIDTKSVIDGLKVGQVGFFGLDVYEQESELFFEDHSTNIVQDDIFQRLLTFPNVLVTGHQGFFTEEALLQIAETTIYNLNCFTSGKPSENSIE